MFCSNCGLPGLIDGRIICDNCKVKYRLELDKLVDSVTAQKDKIRLDLLESADIVVVEFGPLGFSCFEDESLRRAIDKYMDEK